MSASTPITPDPEPQASVPPAVTRTVVTPSAPRERSKSDLWLLLLGGVFVLGLVSLIAGMIVALNGEDAGPFFVLTAVVIAGTLGLFAKGPVD